MKTRTTIHKDHISVYKVYNRGDKYNAFLRWDDTQGKPTWAKLKSMLPGLTILGWVNKRLFTPELVWKTFTYIKIQRTA